MHTIEAMLESHPKKLADVDLPALAACIQACHECSQACTACADACLGEEKVADLVTCIRLNLDCADICATTGNVLSRQSGADVGLTRAVLNACAELCKACGDECERHASMHEHCRLCAQSCRSCEQTCRALLDAIA